MPITTRCFGAYVYQKKPWLMLNGIDEFKLRASHGYSRVRPPFESTVLENLKSGRRSLQFSTLLEYQFLNRRLYLQATELGYNLLDFLEDFL